MDDTKTEHAVQHNTVPPRSRQARKTKSSNAKSRKKTASLQPGTKVPKLKGDFQKVAFEYGYTRFLRRFYSMNKEINRATAEAEWAKLIKARWMDWKKEMPELERRAELDRALSQVSCISFVLNVAILTRISNRSVDRSSLMLNGTGAMSTF